MVMARGLALGIGVGVLALASEVLVLTYSDPSLLVHRIAAYPFDLVNKPLDAILAHSELGDSLRSAQDPLRVLAVMVIWWGLVGGALALVITVTLAKARTGRRLAA